MGDQWKPAEKSLHMVGALPQSIRHGICNCIGSFQGLTGFHFSKNDANVTPKTQGLLLINKVLTCMILSYT